MVSKKLIAVPQRPRPILTAEDLVLQKGPTCLLAGMLTLSNLLSDPHLNQSLDELHKRCMDRDQNRHTSPELKEIHEGYTTFCNDIKRVFGEAGFEQLKRMDVWRHLRFSLFRARPLYEQCIQRLVNEQG